jgi:hypothetical protein
MQIESNKDNASRRPKRDSQDKIQTKKGLSASEAVEVVRANRRYVGNIVSGIFKYAKTVFYAAARFDLARMLLP